MDQRIAHFIAAMRASGVRISLAETADAFKAVEQLGIQDRETFRNSLRATLVKEQRDIQIFEKLFPAFFQPGEAPPMNNATQALSPKEAQMLAQALRQFSQQLREMMQKLLHGEPLTADELAELDQMLNNSEMDDMRYQIGWRGSSSKPSTSRKSARRWKN